MDSRELLSLLFLAVMALELIIQEIKVLGNLKVKNIRTNEEGEEEVMEERKFRVKIGSEQFISKQYGNFVSPNELHFSEPFSYFYDHVSHLLFIQIFAQHQYLDNSDLDQLLSAEVDLADLHSLHGDYVETTLKDIDGQSAGKLILTIQTFKKGKRCYEKVSSKQFFQAVKDEYEKIQASEAARNIKNLIVSNTLADTLMTISSATLICEKEDNEIFMREGFVMVRYGLQLKAFTSLIKIASKDNANWTDYIEFLKNEGVKFQFFFFHFDELGHVVCKAKGEIKYVVFDQTINMHSITLFDKKSNKYGVLMVKFNEKEVDKVNINNKIDKKLIPIEPMVQELIQEFNRYKFQNKFNNKILSEKLWEMEQKEQAEQEEKQRPANPQEKKKNQEHSKFINFLQKEMIKIEKELYKREQNERKDDRKSMFLPTVDKKVNDSRVIEQKEKPEGRYSRKMNSSSISTHQLPRVKLPRI